MPVPITTDELLFAKGLVRAFSSIIETGVDVRDTQVLSFANSITMLRN